jgi:subtilisin family serine protease
MKPRPLFRVLVAFLFLLAGLAVLWLWRESGLSNGKSPTVRRFAKADSPQPPQPAVGNAGANSSAVSPSTNAAAFMHLRSLAAAPSAKPGVGATPGPTRRRLDFRTHYVLINGQRAHPTHLLARRKAGKDEDATLKSLNLAVVRRYSAAGVVLLDNADGSVPPPVLDEAEATARGEELLARARALRDTGAFEYVEPDYIARANVEPSDSAFADGLLWGLKNTGQSNGVAGADIDVVRAWEITTGSTNVIVAVTDTGIRYTHQDLAAQMWNNPGEIPGNGVDDDNDGYVDDVFGINTITGLGDPLDDQNHGSHVAGTIGAAANDGNPHVGAAWQVRLMACKFLDAGGEGIFSDAIECIEFASSKGARVISASWGAYSFSEALYDAIAAAGDLGVLFVAAAGNDGLDNDIGMANYPSSYDLNNVIAVAALDRNNELAYFSNFGRQSVDLAAPGVEIFSCTAESDTSYDIYDGTSMATPHVSGVAALLVAQNPAVSVEELAARLIQFATPVAGFDQWLSSGGRVSAYNALVAQPDGLLEVAVELVGSPRILIGRPATFRVRVSDLAPITNAVVAGALGETTNLVFRNDGMAPDARALDSGYTASVPAPTNAGPVVLSLQISTPGLMDFTTNLTFIVTNPPSNDLFADRILITDNIIYPDDHDGSSTNALLDHAAIVTGNNVDATREDGEQLIFSRGSGKTVWWTFTPASSGVVQISTEGSSFDTMVGIYTGDTVSNLTLVARNDQAYGGERDWSFVYFTVYAGTPYHVAVDGYLGAAGDILMLLTWRPPVAPHIWPDSEYNFYDKHPLHQYALPGKKVYIGVYADGTPPLFYQWQFNGTNILDATNWYYHFTVSSTNDYGPYSVVVSNLAGMITNGPALVEPPMGPLVSVFADGRYVDTTVDLARSAFTVQESLWYLGHPVQPFTNITEAVTNGILVFPSQQLGALTPDLSELDRAALSNFVANGGTLIALGNEVFSEGRTAQFLNSVFGWELAEGLSRGFFGLDIAATGTVFVTGPRELAPQLSSSILRASTLPPGGRPVYTSDLNFDPSETGSVVALLPHGAGHMVYLGWNWYFAVPVYERDGGWLNLLEKATRIKEVPPPTQSPQLRIWYNQAPDAQREYVISFDGFPFERYTLLASTNLADWTVVAELRHSSGQPGLGNFHYFSWGETNHAQQFFQVRQE